MRKPNGGIRENIWTKEPGSGSYHKIWTDRGKVGVSLNYSRYPEIRAANWKKMFPSFADPLESTKKLMESNSLDDWDFVSNLVSFCTTEGKFRICTENKKNSFSKFSLTIFQRHWNVYTTKIETQKTNC